MKILKDLDALLSLINDQSDHYISVNELEERKFYEKKLLNFLCEERYLTFDGSTIGRGGYKLTLNGYLFVLNGGYQGNLKKKRNDIRRNNFYLVATPTIAVIATIISIISLAKTSSKTNHPLHFENHFSFSKDTMIIKSDTISIIP